MDFNAYIELPITVEFDYSPCRPGCLYMPNGDPGYPDEPNELNITSINIVLRRQPDADSTYDEWLKVDLAPYLPDELLELISEEAIKFVVACEEEAAAVQAEAEEAEREARSDRGTFDA